MAESAFLGLRQVRNRYLFPAGRVREALSVGDGQAGMKESPLRIMLDADTRGKAYRKTGMIFFHSVEKGLPCRSAA